MLDRLGWLAFVLLLIPAGVRYQRTRSLLRHVNDPALPERMVGSRTLMAATFSGIAAIVVALSPRLAPITIPLQIVLFALAGWPLRRALFQETWSFASYLWFFIRLIVAVYGYWLLLVSSIWLTDLSSGRGLLITITLAAVLLIFNDKFPAFLRFVLRTKPVTTPGLTHRFAAIVAKTTITPPNVEYVDMRGGTLVNALALPGIRKSTVLFTSTLLERFDEEEVEAIFAHELAHLEHYNPARLKRLRLTGWLLIVLTVSIPPIVRAFAPRFAEVVAFWPLVILGYMVAHNLHKQKHETESDLRSAALTGNPEVMVRALIKLYEMMKLPRRLDPAAEVHATHPSLARRIQAIRSAAGSSGATLTEPITLHHQTATVTLHADHVTWAEGGVTAYTLAYSALDELRITADGPGAIRLVASDPAGRKWTIPLAAEDVPRAHAALNVVEAQLRPAPAGASRWTLWGRIAAIWCALATVGVLQLAAGVVALLAAIVAEPPLLRAAGAATVAAGALNLVTDDRAAAASLPIVVGLLTLLLAWRDRREVISRAAWRSVAVIGFCVLPLSIPLALAAPSWLAMHQAARLWPSLSIAAIAFAAANWPRRSRGSIAATAAASVVGIAAFALTTTRAADVLVDDPFLSHVARSEALMLPNAGASTFKIAVLPESLVLSPGARAIAAVTEDDYEEHVFHIGRPGKVLTEVNADAAVFVDDDHALLLDHDRAMSRLSFVHADAPQTPIWTTEIRMASSTLSVGSGGGSWQLLGTGETGDVQRVSGTMDGVQLSKMTWRVGSRTDGRQSIPLLAGENRLLVHETSYARRGIRFPGMSPAWQAWIDPWRWESNFVQVAGAERRALLHSQLDVDCALRPIIGEEPICWAYDGSRTHMFTINIEGKLTPLAMLPSRINVDAARGWITGWGRRPYAINLETRRLYEVGYNRGFLIASGDFLGVISEREESAVVHLYRINAR
jgi:heat shock protein HtpX